MLSGGYSLPVIHVGWQVVDPGPAPTSSLINAVPDTGDAAVHALWRRRVEAENQALSRQHERRAVWFPVQRSPDEYILPFFGGRPATWQGCVATLVGALLRGGFDGVRVVNLSRHRVLDELHRLSRHSKTPWATECQVISRHGSSVDLVPSADLAGTIDAIILFAEAQQSGGEVRAASLRVALREVGGCLTGPVSLGRLGQAVRLVVTGTAPTGSSCSVSEEQSLRRLHAELQLRPKLREDLDSLELVMTALRDYAKPAGPAQRLGKGEIKVRTLEVETSASGRDDATGRLLAASFVVRAFARKAPPSTKALIVAGADELTHDEIESLAGSAHAHSKQLILLFEHLTEQSQRYLGLDGTQTAVFFALPNAAEAELAARHLGHEFKFVVNGITVSEGMSEQWSTTHTVSTDRSTNNSVNFGRDFSRSISRGQSEGEATAEQRGGGRTYEQSKNFQRVREYVIEPEQFQTLPDTVMLVIQGKRVTLADCRPEIRALPITAASPYSG